MLFVYCNSPELEALWDLITSDNASEEVVELSTWEFERNAQQAEIVRGRTLSKSKFMAFWYVERCGCCLMC